jgi:hypothetical protein
MAMRFDHTSTRTLITIHLLLLEKWKMGGGKFPDPIGFFIFLPLALAFLAL